ncbi:hypothetical protein ABZ816_30810 [Actinosynnema sp. NPDC047251]|uniref:Uncharacterized protein n=1 Tax=Saccharothrix espanaensis (strain ATCC 51144 / DSM 44229 / JCM 9112 / NBRC 15066 / NRRL 15764) TaxID=1179773 RepID=K0K394_SACES|nr:hypothetical protein [Saccharothrix espanaensis]CCH32781.1 hypothetical protein BN6_55220 [Saccharothrix espanaensis DSM 44229]
MPIPPTLVGGIGSLSEGQFTMSLVPAEGSTVEPLVSTVDR